MTDLTVVAGIVVVAGLVVMGVVALAGVIVPEAVVIGCTRADAGIGKVGVLALTGALTAVECTLVVAGTEKVGVELVLPTICI